MATITMSMLKPIHANAAPKALTPSIKPISLLKLPKGLVSLPKATDVTAPSPLTSAALAGAIFSSLSFTDAAFAAQQIADLAEGDNRGLALLLPIIPAILWVLYNILQPALNQLNRMRSKGVVVGLGLGSGLAAGGFLSAPEASANELASIAEATNDSRGLLLLFVIVPAIAWVLYNILQPALNQINKMRS